MKQYTYYSNFAERINAFIDYKRALGYAYGDSSRILREFDLLCNEKFHEKNILDRELGLTWLERKATEAEGSHRNRIMVIREFAKYLCSVGEPAYLIPITMTRKPKRYTPHIFTDNELTAFFRAADSFTTHDKAPARHLVVPAFFRTVYCCGLRPSKARLLLTENVDLNRGILCIIESKGHKADLFRCPRICECFFADMIKKFPKYILIGKTSFRVMMETEHIQSSGRRRCSSAALIWRE